MLIRCSLVLGRVYCNMITRVWNFICSCSQVAVIFSVRNFTHKDSHPVYLRQQGLMHLYIVYLVGCAFSLYYKFEVVRAHLKSCVML